MYKMYKYLAQFENMMDEAVQEMSETEINTMCIDMMKMMKDNYNVQILDKEDWL